MNQLVKRIRTAYTSQKKGIRWFALSATVLLLGLFLVPSIHHKIRYKQRALSLPNVALQTHEEATNDNEEAKWTMITTQPGDSLALIFKRLDLSAHTLHAIIQNKKSAAVLTHIKPGRELKFLIENNQLEKLIFPYSDTQYLFVSHKGKQYHSVWKTRKLHVHNQYVTALVTGSLYESAKKMGISYKLINQMTEIFNWEIDFAKDVRTNDHFTIIYKAYYLKDKLVKTGKIIAVSFTNKGTVHSAVQYINKRGESDYYNAQGQSLKMAFSRYPLKFSHMSSTFTLSRYHPILHYRRAHKGVDLAARIGTPIMATGNGVIETIGNQGGYGNMIKIKHDKMYSSIYGHMLRFRKGLVRGSHVKRGQVIGYVGQTGLASGPHCHYEFHVHNQPRNPSTIKLPRTAPIAGKEFRGFKVHTRPLLAHLHLFEEATLASLHHHKDASVG